MILLIDNYDSFTFNLYQQIAGFGYEVLVRAHDRIDLAEIEFLKPEKVVISPGPKSPRDSGVSCAVIERFYRELPILGVCLGHQCIGEVFGAKTVGAKAILHGKTAEVFHNESAIFAGLPNPMLVARYHSLAVSALPEGFNLLAWTADEEIMAMKHQDYPLVGVQFHPESFMTVDGDKLMLNFLDGRF